MSITGRTAAAASVLPFSLSWLMPISAAAATQLDGLGAFLTLGLFAGIIPLLDTLSGDRVPRSRRSNPPRGPFTLLLLGFLPLHATVLGLALLRLRGPFEWTSFIGLTLSVGLAGSVAIVAAHDLIHRQARWSRVTGYGIMALFGYVHFGLSHRIGHHAKAATPSDPSSAYRGQSFFHFLGRSLWHQFHQARSHEVQRLRRRGRSAFHPTSAVYLYLACPVILLSLALVFAGWIGVALVTLQAAIAVLMLEAVSYIQHYGLRRVQLSNGRYEPIGRRHSWESRARVSNWFLLNIQLHGDHHVHAQRPYQELSPRDESPQLPAGFPCMIALALIPRLWRRCIHPQLDQMGGATGPRCTVGRQASLDILR